MQLSLALGITFLDERTSTRSRFASIERLTGFSLGDSCAGTLSAHRSFIVTSTGTTAAGTLWEA